jgi:hypothetical protein
MRWQIGIPDIRSLMAPKGFVPLIHLNPDHPTKPTKEYTDGAPNAVEQGTPMEIPPWDKEGKRYRGRGWKNEQADEFWHRERFRQVSLQEAIADFYLLEGLAVQAIEPPPGTPVVMPKFDAKVLLDLLEDGFEPGDEPTLANITLSSMIAREALVARMAPILADYAHYACAGELCYHTAVRTLGNGHTDAVCSWYKLREHAGGADAARWAAELFEDPCWNGSFGGKAWAQCARVLEWYESGQCEGMPFSAREFCDRIFSMQHNTGSFLNKVSWKSGTDSLKVLLDAHHESNWSKLAMSCSDEVRILIERYWDANNDRRSDAGAPIVKMPYGMSVGKWRSIAYSPHDQTVEFEGVTYCAWHTNGERCHWHDKCSMPKWYMFGSFLKSFDTFGIALYDGVCKTSGEPFTAGTEVVYHGKGAGATTKEAWEAQYGPVFKWGFCKETDEIADSMGTLIHPDDDY